MNKNGTYSIFPEDSSTVSATTLPVQQIAEVVRQIIREEGQAPRKRTKKEKKRDKQIDELLLKKKKKKKSKSKKKSRKGKRSKHSLVDGIIRESASTALKMAEMYAASKFSSNSNP